MTEETAEKQDYMVNVSEPHDGGGPVIFTFVPKGQLQDRGPRGIPKRVPQFVVAVRLGEHAPSFEWNGSPDEPGPHRDEIELEIATRMKDRSVWIERVTELIGRVELWARELGWSTRRIEKKLDDARIGNHRVPALLMQEDACRMLLEPVGRSATGIEGAVDLYLMPAYDDIANLYYYDNRWNVHYDFPETKSTVTMSALPLSKETLEKVLAEMRQNAV